MSGGLATHPRGDEILLFIPLEQVSYECGEITMVSSNLLCDWSGKLAPFISINQMKD